MVLSRTNHVDLFFPSMLLVFCIGKSVCYKMIKLYAIVQFAKLWGSSALHVVDLPVEATGSSSVEHFTGFCLSSDTVL